MRLVREGTVKKLAILAAFALIGCDAVIPNTMAGLRAQDSQKAYKTCLIAAQQQAKDGKTPNTCETERKLYDLDMGYYRATPQP